MRIPTARGDLPTSRSTPTPGAFLNDHDGAGDRMPPVFAVLGRLTPEAGYHEPSARDARRRILAFFDAHLKPED